MKPTKLDIRTEGSLGGREVLMGLDDDGLTHIMSILTDLYSDPVLAVIREYSCNALDSHVEARQTRPIEVDLPGALRPTFIVKDFGVGLSVDEIINVYSKYGASTKRDSNEVVGMLGLGSKSGLTYSAQFTVVAIKDGVKTSVVVGRNADGRGEMEIVDTVSTNEPNGVTIEIPIKMGDSGKFIERATTFFRAWKPGTVLVNGKQPDHFVGDVLTDRVMMVEDIPHDYVVMGNVPYPVDRQNFNFYQGYYRNWGVVVNVPIGSVSITPSREALNYTKHTLQTLEKHREEYMKVVEQRAKDEIAKSDNPLDAYKAWQKWRGRFSGILTSNFSFNGEVAPHYRLAGFEYRPYVSRYSTSGIRTQSWTNLIGGLLISGFTKAQVNPNDKRKIRQYIEDNDLNTKAVFLFDNITAIEPNGNARTTKQDWLVGFDTVDWDTIRSIRLKPQSNYSFGPNGKATDGGYRIITKSGAEEIKHDLKSTDKIVFYTPADNERSWARSLFEKLNKYGEADYLVELERNRWDKFLRLFPSATKIENAHRKLAKVATDALTADEKTALSVDSFDSGVMTRANRLGLTWDDPKLKKLSTIVALDTDNMRRYNEIIGGTPITPHRVFNNNTYHLVDRYVYNINDNYVKHLNVYANAIYSDRKGN